MGVLSKSKKRETSQSAFLKVVHPKGYVEIFRKPITAGEIMTRYPRHCIARTDFFEFPWIVVHPESVLFPGGVFLLVPHSTVDKVLKRKRQHIESLNFKQDQSAKQTNHYLKLTPKNQQEDRHYSRQTNLHHHRINKESYCDGRQEQDPDNGSLYKLPFYESWNKMRGKLDQPHQESYDYPACFSPEQVELQRLKSCLRMADSDRKKINLKVSFASPVVIPGSRRGSSDCSAG